jgi:hypothetical protein
MPEPSDETAAVSRQLQDGVPGLVYSCVWVLPNDKMCGYVQRFPGDCPYAHTPTQHLVPTRLADPHA